MIINNLFILVVYLLYNCNIVYSKDYPLEQYYITNKNYSNKVIRKKKPNPELVMKTVYSGTTIANTIKKIDKTIPNYKEEVTKVLNNGKTVDFGNFFDIDPFDVFLDANKITKNVVLNFTTTFGDQIIEKRRTAEKRNFQMFNPYYQSESEKEIINMYKHMMNMKNDDIDFDAILNVDTTNFVYIESSLNLDYAITSLNNQNILNWMLNGNNKSYISKLYNVYGLTVDSDNFLNLVIETLINNNPNIGLMLSTQEKFNKFKLIVESIFTNYSFPNNFGIYVASNNTETSNDLIENLSSDIINDLYDLYLKVNRYIDNSNHSFIDLVLQELIILNIKEAGVTEEVNIDRNQFYKSVSEIFDIYKKGTEMIENIQLDEGLSDDLIIEQLTSAHSLVLPNIISIFVESEEDNKKIFRKLILNYDFIMKYSKNMSKEQQKKIADCANLFINMLSSLYSKDFRNRFVYNRVSSGEDFIDIGLIVPYHINENRDEYFRYIIYAVSLMKQDLSSMFQIGDNLIYGYERNICFEIDDQNQDGLFITNKIDKDCIFKGSKASNEAIYKITKVYYDTFIANCQDDIINLNKATNGNILHDYLHFDIVSDNQFMTFHLPTVKMYINSNFENINNIFNSIFQNHEDEYISAASNLLKKMGLYMIDTNLLFENLYNDDEEIGTFELKDIELPKSKMLEIEEINNELLNWGDSIIDMDYSNYFMYQYYSLLYYIEDQGEDVRGNSRLDHTILMIKENSKNIIQNCQYFGNLFLLKNILDRYENLVSVITEYIYQYDLNYINSDNYVPDDMIANEYDKLVQTYDNYIKNIESMINTSYYSLIGNISSDVMENYISETINTSNKIKNIFNNNLNGENKEKPNYENDLIEKYEVLRFSFLALLRKSLKEINVSKYTEDDIGKKIDNMINSIDFVIPWGMVLLKVFYLNFMGHADNSYFTEVTMFKMFSNYMNSKIINEDNAITNNENKLFDYKEDEIDITDIDITEDNGDYYISYNKNGENKTIKLEENGILKSLIDGNKLKETGDGEIEVVVKDEDQESPSIYEDSPRYCRDDYASWKRSVGKSNCNKKQILREFVINSENIKTTIKNNIGKLDDIDPDYGYRELEDSVNYSTYLSEAFDYADDFSENSQFGEDTDSPISLEDHSNNMRKSSNTLKYNVEAATSKDMLSKSKIRSRRHTNKHNRGNIGKSPNNVVNSSSKK